MTNLKKMDRRGLSPGILLTTMPGLVKIGKTADNDPGTHDLYTSGVPACLVQRSSRRCTESSGQTGSILSEGEQAVAALSIGGEDVTPESTKPTMRSRKSSVEVADPLAYELPGNFPLMFCNDLCGDCCR